jgi:geranylgeranyl reductase family protein
MIETDICIVGAGPGGAATALKLSYLGIPSILVDKAVFPRDKICGDAISGKVTTLLNRLDPNILKRFNGTPQLSIDIWGIRFIAPNLREIDIPFKPNFDKASEPIPGYVSKRVDFDNFLIEEVKRRSNIQLHEGVAIDSYERVEGGYVVSSKDGSFRVQCKLLMVANGAYSPFTRHHAGLEKDPKHYAGAIRAYYRNVTAMHDDNFIELHFIKNLVPGYLWVFPLPDGQANVGVGMRSDHISRKKVNLKKVLDEAIQHHPKLKDRFQHAERIGKVEGFGLPLGSKRRPISGDHFLLIGDAGHLIDPLSGEGIGNAFYSGFIAAELAEKCLAENDFSAKFLEAYDIRVARVLGSEMKLSYRLQQVLSYPRLANFMGNLIYHNRRILDVLSRMYNDLSVRRQLVNPVFWVRILFGKK